MDSKSGSAVMDLLRDLYQRGATICMVTHDPRYAHYAGCSLNLFDGQFVSTEDRERIKQLEESGF